MLADLIFFLVVGLVALISIILYFHWKKYSLGGPLVAFMEILYVVVCVTLLATAFYSLN